MLQCLQSFSYNCLLLRSVAELLQRCNVSCSVAVVTYNTETKHTGVPVRSTTTWWFGVCRLRISGLGYLGSVHRSGIMWSSHIIPINSDAAPCLSHRCTHAMLLPPDAGVS